MSNDDPAGSSSSGAKELPALPPASSRYNVLSYFMGPTSDENNLHESQSSNRLSKPSSRKRGVEANDDEVGPDRNTGPHGEKFRVGAGLTQEDFDRERAASQKLEHALKEANNDLSFQRGEISKLKELLDDESMQRDVDEDLVHEAQTQLREARQQYETLQETASGYHRLYSQSEKVISELRAGMEQMRSQFAEDIQKVRQDLQLSQFAVDMQKAQRDLLQKENEIQTLRTKRKHSAQLLPSSQPQSRGDDQDVDMDRPQATSTPSQHSGTAPVSGSTTFDSVPASAAPTTGEAGLATLFREFAGDIKQLLQNSQTPPASAQGTPTSGAKRRGKCATKQGSYGHKMELKKMAYDALSPQIKKQLNADILHEFKELCGIKTLHSGDYQPVDEEIAHSHLLGTHAGPQGELQYSLYFGEDWKQISWNKIVVSNMAAAVSGALEDAGTTVHLSSDVIQAIIWSFVVQVQGAYKRSLPRADEDQAEADTRTKEYRDYTNDRMRVRSRKIQKLDKRRERVKQLLEHKDNLEHRIGQVLLDDLDVDGQSSEYTDDENPAGLKVLVPKYRHKAIGPILHGIDVQGAALYERSMKQLGFRKRLPASKKRRFTGQESTSQTVKRLPRYCYDDAFFNKLSGPAKEGLDISDKQYPQFDQWVALHRI